jgi:hypothetical protein
LYQCGHSSIISSSYSIEGFKNTIVKDCFIKSQNYNNMNYTRNIWMNIENTKYQSINVPVSNSICQNIWGVGGDFVKNSILRNFGSVADYKGSEGFNDLTIKNCDIGGVIYHHQIRIK